MQRYVAQPILLSIASILTKILIVGTRVALSKKGQIQMELFLCDNCDTLASVEVIGDELKIAQCNCVRTKGI